MTSSVCASVFQNYENWDKLLSGFFLSRGVVAIFIFLGNSGRG